MIKNISRPRGFPNLCDAGRSVQEEKEAKLDASQ